MEPLARQGLAQVARNGQTILLSLEQTELGDRMAVLRVNGRIADRSLSLAWVAEAETVNIGLEGQRRVLEQVQARRPEEAQGRLSADRFYPSVGLFNGLHAPVWHYWLCLKGNLGVDPGYGEEVTTGDLAQGLKEHYLPGVQLLAHGVSTNLGILCEDGTDVFQFQEPWFSSGGLAPGTRGPLGTADSDHGPGYALVCTRRPSSTQHPSRDLTRSNGGSENFTAASSPGSSEDYAA